MKLKHIFTLIFPIILFSCDKNEQLVNPKKDNNALSLARTFTSTDQIYQLADSIGLLHNEAMEYCFHKYELTHNPNNQPDINQLEQHIVDFYNSKGYDLSEYSNTEILDDEPQFENLSEDARGIVNEILSSYELYEIDNDTTQLFQNMESLMQESLSLTSTDEALICASIASQTKYSVRYWENNMGKYYELFGGEKGPTNAKMNAAQAAIGRADLIGLCCGALGGAPTGIGIVFGGMFGGAYSSFAEAMFH